MFKKHSQCKQKVKPSTIFENINSIKHGYLKVLYEKHKIKVIFLYKNCSL